MNILALIPARAGSKRIPGKNSRVLGDKPLIEWSIEAAKSILGVEKILVSTDDPELFALAKQTGVNVPWLRPLELSSDTATSVDVSVHALDWYEAHHGVIDGLLLLQPTSPFRSTERLLQGIEIFRESKFLPVVGVSPAESHPMLCYRVDGMSMYPYLNKGIVEVRSQELPSAYVINGAFYLITPDMLRKNKSFFSENMQPLLMDLPEEAVDIDTELDWKLAEFALMTFL